MNPEAAAWGVPRGLTFGMPGWHVWDGAILPTGDGRFTLFFSRWPLERGHDAWIDHSEICRAEGPEPWGPFEYVETVFRRGGGSAWDEHNFHNVTIKQFGGTYFMYYTGNHGNGDWWDHRNHQRIGVATAPSVRGPWTRRAAPLIDISPDGWDSLMVSNPTAIDLSDGRYVLLYKGVTDGPRPFGSRVLHGLAVAERPDGPFRKLPDPVFVVDGVKFAFEDPYLVRRETGCLCLMKDMDGVRGPCPVSVLAFESPDGVTWDADRFTVVATPYLLGPGDEVEFVERLERPHYFADPVKPCFSFAVKPHGDAESFLVFRPGALPGASA